MAAANVSFSSPPTSACTPVMRFMRRRATALLLVLAAACVPAGTAAAGGDEAAAASTPADSNEALLAPTWNPSLAAQRERQIALGIRDELASISRKLGDLSKATEQSSQNAAATLEKLTAGAEAVGTLVRQHAADDLVAKRYEKVVAQLAALTLEVRSKAEAHAAPTHEEPAKSVQLPPAKDIQTSPGAITVVVTTPKPTTARTRPDGSAAAPAETASSPTQQLGPSDDLAREFPGATFEYVAVGVPDPRVPRHQRAYEFSVGAIMSGMADGGFELDRYWFPWVDYKVDSGKPESAASAVEAGNCSGSIAAGAFPITKAALESARVDMARAGAAKLSPACFGLMTFRLDEWRDPALHNPSVRVRVVYLLPETVTYGVQPAALAGAIAHVATRLPATSSALWHGQCAARASGSAAAKASRRLLVAGPVFSGSSTSYATALRPFLAEDFSVCLLAYSATATSNAQLSEYALPKDRFEIASLTVDDDTKRGNIFETAGVFGFKPKQVVFFVEKSTFGNSVCPPKDTRCRAKIGQGQDTNVILFDSNIAELRERHAQQSVSGADTQLVDMMNPHLSHVLRVDDMTENGNEYPVSKHSSMNVAGTDLALSRQIARLRHFGSDPRMVVVAATEVRDRLYLITAIKEAMPWVVTVDLESDILLSHPDFIPATRGTLTFGSAEIQLERAQSMQSDNEVKLRGLVQELKVTAVTHPVKAAQSIDIVGRNGPRPTAFKPGAADTWLTIPAWFFIDIREHVGALLVILGLVVLPPWRRIRGGCRMLRAKWMIRVLDIGARVMTVALLLGTAVALAYSIVVAWYVLFDQKNELLDKVLVCVLLVIAFWTGRQLCRLVRIDTGAVNARTRRIRVWSRWQLLRSVPGRTLTLGIVVGAVACIVLTLNQGDLLWKVLAAIGEEWANRLSDQPAARPYNLLDVSVTDGLAVAVTYVGAIAMTAFAMCVTVSVARLRGMVRPLWVAISQATSGSAPLSPQRELHHVSRLLLWLFVFPAVYFLSSWTPLGASGLGIGYDVGFYIAMIATATTALGALALVVGYLERMLQRCNEIVRWSRGNAPAAAPTAAAAFLGPWHGVGPTRMEFAYTPVVATRPTWFPAASSVILAANILRNACANPPVDTVAARESFALLLASEIAAMRTLLALAMLSCFAGVLLVYAFPVPRRDALLFIDMALMIVTAVVSAYVTIRLERHALVSRILCDQEEGIQLSLSLIRTLAFPFVLIALSLLIAEVPGVREWSGSYLGSLLKLIGGGR